MYFGARTCRDCHTAYNVRLKTPDDPLAGSTHGRCPQCRTGRPRVDSAPTATKPPEPDWTGALCRQVGNPDLWFSDDWRELKQAKAICEACPLKDACHQYALDTGQRFGVWGGQNMARTPAAQHERQRSYQRDYKERKKAGIQAPPKPPKPRVSLHQQAVKARDAEIMRLTRLQWSSRAIATRLGISQRTVLRVRKQQRSAA